MWITMRDGILWSYFWGCEGWDITRSRPNYLGYLIDWSMWNAVSSLNFHWRFIIFWIYNVSSFLYNFGFLNVGINLSEEFSFSAFLCFLIGWFSVFIKMEKIDIDIFFHLAIIQMHEVHYLADYNDKNIVNSFY